MHIIALPESLHAHWLAWLLLSIILHVTLIDTNIHYCKVPDRDDLEGAINEPDELTSGDTKLSNQFSTHTTMYYITSVNLEATCITQINQTITHQVLCTHHTPITITTTSTGPSHTTSSTTIRHQDHPQHIVHSITHHIPYLSPTMA